MKNKLKNLNTTELENLKKEVENEITRRRTMATVNVWNESLSKGGEDQKTVGGSHEDMYFIF